AAGKSGVVHIDGKTGQASVYRHDPKNPTSLAGDMSFTIFIDEQEKVWIGGRGLNLFDANKKSFTHFLTDNHVRHVLGNSDGKLLIGHGRGLYSFDPQNGKSELVADGWSTSMIRDRQGVIWHSSLWGLSQIDPKTRKFRLEFRTNELFGKCVLSIVMDANNDIWMLDIAEGAHRFDPSFRKVIQQVQKRYAGISADSEGSIWLISSDKLEKYDFRFKTIAGEKMPIMVREPILSTFVDSFGNIWTGGFDSVGKYNPKTKTWEQLGSFPTGQVYCFLEDRYKNLWIGSSAGVVRYNLMNGNLDIFESDPNNKQSLSDNRVFNMMMDAEENIWIGTSGGLNKMIKGTENGKPGFVSWQSRASGLPNDNVTCIVDGGDGTLWLTCGNMISHFDPEENHFRNYGHRDGLAGTSFRDSQYGAPKGLRTSEGKIVFSTYCKGLVIFHPDSLVDNDYVPPVVITDFLINNQRVPLAKSEADTLKWETPLKKGISYTREVGLRHNQNDFSFEFAALNFVNSESNRYKYKLEPYESEWIVTNASNRVARYTNIDPGEYTFRVIGSNNDGVWNEEGASLVIVITPPWWQTWWAYTVYGLFVFAIILSWRNYDIKRVKLKNRAEHLSELDNLKSRFFANISHEFRTPITLIMGPLRNFYGKASKDDQKVFGVMLRNAQRLLRLINQLLDLSKIEAGKMQLHTSPLDLVEFLRQIASSYESMAA
ncbi:MAG: two-component regulator propeller domain-containing protein, partial [Cyclobacteriaceae bacterium]